METFIGVCLVLLTFIGLTCLSITAVTEWHRSTGKVCGIVAFFLTAGLLTLMTKYEEDNPCVRYETQMRYDPALKMVRPMKTCVERGEWVEEPQ